MSERTLYLCEKSVAVIVQPWLLNFKESKMNNSMRFIAIILLAIVANLSGCGGGGSTPSSGSGSSNGSDPFTITAVSSAAEHLALNVPMAAFWTVSAASLSGDYQMPATLMHSGTLPQGLTFNTTNGMIEGTPTAIYPSTDIHFFYRDANGKETNHIVINFTVLDNSFDLTGVTGNGISLSGKLRSPFMVSNGSNLVDRPPYLKRSSDGKTHTYYYWDVDGDGTTAGDLVTHDQLDQIFNGGTLGDNAMDMTAAAANTIILSNGLHVHLLSIPEFLGVITQSPITGWPAVSFWTTSQIGIGGTAGQHNTYYYGAYTLLADTTTAPVFFEVW